MFYLECRSVLDETSKCLSSWGFFVILVNMEHPPSPLHKGEKIFDGSGVRRVAGLLPPCIN